MCIGKLFGVFFLFVYLCQIHLAGSNLIDTPVNPSNQIIINDSQLARRFDGIGGLSAGASSSLLFAYEEKVLNEILDYLFLPNFGASIQFLKVEIGGDGQSTDGTEPSHMHSPDDFNFNRGYEWRLLTEAKLRNPDIITWALSWTFPGWLCFDQNNQSQCGSGPNPYFNRTATANYTVQWLLGAKLIHNISIDWIGVWNERQYDSEYIKVLRNMLDQHGLQSIKIAAADDFGNDICQSIASDNELSKSVDAIGIHYPGTYSSDLCSSLPQKLWSSEDYSSFSDYVGGGCWARILNQNYVNGNYTSTIAWALIASWYSTLPFSGDGLLIAEEPWSNNYIIPNTVWVTAHTTQFAFPGWYYLKHGSGVGLLSGGGSFVSLVDPSSSSLSIIIETLSHDNSICIRPDLPPFNSSATQLVTINLSGSFSQIKQLYLWRSQLNKTASPDKVFEYIGPLTVVNQTLTLLVEVDCLYTLTTLNRGQKGDYGTPAPSRPFPFPYFDDFNGYDLDSNAAYFSDQTGSWSITQASIPNTYNNNDDVTSSHDKVMKQYVTNPVLGWVTDAINAISILGDDAWSDYSVSGDVLVEGKGNDDRGRNILVGIAGRVGSTGQNVATVKGIFLWLEVSPSNSSLAISLSTDIAKTEVLAYVSIKNPSVSAESWPFDVWHSIGLMMKGESVSGYYNNALQFKVELTSKAPMNGVAAITSSLDFVQHDNFNVSSV